MKFIYFLALNFLFSSLIFSSKNHKIAKEIAGQSGCNNCEKRVTDWFSENPENNLYKSTKPWEKPGVKAFHRIPLAATKYIERFKYNYGYRSDSNYNTYDVVSTPGIIRFFDINNNPVYRPVMFEVGTFENDTVVHRVATTQPPLNRARESLAAINTHLKNYIVLMEDKLFKNKNSNHSDESYICSERTDGSAIIASSKDKSIGALVFLKKSQNS